MNWNSFLNDIFLGDREIIDTMQRLVGYASTGDKTAGIIVVCHGEGRNGRTTFFRALQLALDEGVVFFNRCLLDAVTLSLPSNDLFRLKEAGLAVLEDLLGVYPSGVSALKCLSSDDLIYARRPWGKEGETFRNLSTPFLAGGDLPSGSGRELAFLGRLVIIPFPVRFVPGETGTRTWKKSLRSGTVLSSLAGDINSIGAWIEEGARRYRAEGLAIPDRFRASSYTARRVA